MKKLKVILALMLVACLFVTMFAACAKDTSKPSTDAGAAGDAGNNAPVEDEETAEIIFSYYDMRGYGGDHGERVGAAIDKYCREKINVGVDVVYYASGDWRTKGATSLSGGERMDVICLFANAIASYYAQSLMMDITDYLNEYASETMELVKDYLGPYTFGGRIYGLPTLRNYAKNGYILFNKDILEEYGLVEQAEAIDSWSDYAAVMQAMLDKGIVSDKGIYPTRGNTGDFPTYNYVSRGDNFADMEAFDNLGDGTYMVYCNQDGKIGLFPEHEGFVYEISLMADWAEKGYVWPESEVTTEFVDDCVRYGYIASYIAGSEMGVDVVKSGTWKIPCLAVQTASAMIKTSQPMFTGIGVPYTCEEPEAACKFLNLMYTDPKLMNMICWGVEGEDYTVVNGEVVHDKESYFLGADFVMGNSLLLTPLAGNGADFYERVKQVNATSPVSQFMGFAIDTTELEQYISNLTAVTDQYHKALFAGRYTPDFYAEYLAKLEAADVRGYLGAVQTQLDAWRAANGK